MSHQRRALWFRLAVPSLLGLTMIVSGCRKTPPEQALREAISDLAAAIEARDADAIQGLLADDFIGNDGLDREGVRRMAALQFLRSQQVRVVLGPLKITLRPNTLQPDHATVSCPAALTGGAGGLLPDSGSLYDAQSGWRFEDGQWRMTSLAWKVR